GGARAVRNPRPQDRHARRGSVRPAVDPAAGRAGVQPGGSLGAAPDDAVRWGDRRAAAPAPGDRRRAPPLRRPGPDPGPAPRTRWPIPAPGLTNPGLHSLYGAPAAGGLSYR